MTVLNYNTNLFDKNLKQEYHVLVNNGRAKLEQDTFGKIYVVIDGVRVEADRNDLFGVNSNPNEWLEQLIEQYDRQMGERDEKISFLEQAQVAIKKSIKTVKEAITKILAYFGVSTIDQISDESQQQEALSLKADEWNFRFEKTSISNRLYSACLSNFMDACSKGKLSNQLAFNKAMQNKYSAVV